MDVLLDAVEAPLSELRRMLAADASKTACHELALACRDYLEVHRAGKYAKYNAAALIEGVVKAWAAKTGSEQRVRMELDESLTAIGDLAQVRACLRALLGSVEFITSSTLMLELFEEKDVPHLSLAFDGPGTIHDPVRFGPGLMLPRESMVARWTVATRGAGMKLGAHELLLRLTGQRVVPDPLAEVETELEPVREIEQRLRLMIQEKTSEESMAAVLSSVDAALAVLDAAGSRLEPADIGALVKEIADECRKDLEHHALALEIYVDAEVPAVPVRRPLLQRFFRNGFAHARESLRRGGAVTVFVEYDAAAQSLDIEMTITGTQCETDSTAHITSMGRAIEESHQGSFDFGPSKGGVAIHAIIPDPVGQTLEAWLPGYTAFSEQSRQMLRLLKSGGPAPPEDFILPGVLENELGQWLLSRLSGPAMVNMAHGLPPATELPGSSPERLQKVQQQIQRGKPKKELAQPQYAGEILGAFARDDRGRTALGVEALTPEQVRDLAVLLLQERPDYLGCLKLVAKVRQAHKEERP